MSYIEPCCTDNQLPRLLRSQTCALFQTSGDVTIAHMLKAVLPLSGDRPRTLTLCLQQLSPSVVSLLNRYMRLEWISQLHLCLASVPADINQQLSAIGVPLNRICVYTVNMPTNLLLLQGSKVTVAIQGQLEADPASGLHLYAAQAAPAGSPTARTLTDTLQAYLKPRLVPTVPEPVEGPTVPEPVEGPAPTEPSPQKRKKGGKKQ